MVSVAMEQSAVSGAPPSPSPARSVTVLVNGAPVTVAEPAWCTVDHGAEGLRTLENLHHAGPSISLPVPEYGGGVEHVLLAQLVQWPFEGRHDHKGRPYISFDAAGGGSCNGYGSAGVLALVDQVIAHCEQVRALAYQLQAAEAEAGTGDAS